MTLAAAHEDHAWWTLDVDQTVEAVGSDLVGGLSTSEAEARAEQVGPNEIEEEPTRPRWLIFVTQFANTMIVVLLIAAAITVAIGEVKDAIVISAIVVLNAAIGYFQEYRAEQAMAALRTMAAPEARVMRDGVEVTIPGRDLVPGDLLVLEAGDIVPADARLVDCPNLRVNEAALTGESVPVDKHIDVLSHQAGELVADRHNMVLKGTAVVYGRARAVVVTTGMSTALGEIAGLLKAHQSPRTPLQLRLAVLGRWLAAASVAVCAIVFTVGVARGEEVSLMFLTAVSLAVAAIPEALPAVVTIALALGAQRMVHQHALVRKLPAVETLGSVTVICSDKTGTLTQGRMLVEKAWTSGGEVTTTGSGYEPGGQLLADGEPLALGDNDSLASMVVAAALCNDAVLVAPTAAGGDWAVAGDPTEGALLAFAAKGGAARDELQHAHPRLAEIPFDSDRKRMTTVHRGPNRSGRLIASKGALEAVLETVSSIAEGNEPRPMSEADRSKVVTQAEDYAAAGYRVLAVAGRIDDGDSESVLDAEHNLTLYGLVAMADPPRPESAAAVAACRTAGITPVMITGDHPATAAAIASRLGILDDQQVMTGAELAREHSEGLADHVDRVGVYARTSPEQKLDIVQAWKKRGDIVAMTGDGVNDAPALRAADIGVAMGVAGTEVAKEAADMVLTNDDFASIVTAAGQGRRIYDNIRRFVRYTLTSNAGEIWVMLLGPFLGLPLPLLPVHILWINLVTDGLPGLALGVEPAERNVMKRPPRPPSESIFAHGMPSDIIFVGLLMGLIPLGLGVWGEATDRPWQTMVFVSLALLQLGNAMAMRSETESLWSLGIMSNRPLLWAVGGTLIVQLLVIYLPFAQTMFTVDPLSLFELVIVLAASTGIFWVVEGEKAYRRRRARRKEAAAT